MIRVSGLHFTYPGAAAPALQGLDFSLSAGELMLCTGPSGSGKSSLLKVLNGIIPAHVQGDLRGEVRVGGVNVPQSTPQAMAAVAGTLFQDPERQFFALNVREEISLALQWRGASREEAGVAAENAARRLGIEDILDNSIFHLSEGQKQKVAIAALLASGPSVLLFDEPSANLDPESMEELARLLAMLKSQGQAIFVADHRLAWLRGMADKVLVLRDGAQEALGAFDVLEDDALRVRCGLRDVLVTDPRAALPPMPEGEAVFCCRGISFAYRRGPQLLRQASFAFPGGCIAALTGPNGVGKTTLARLCSGLEKSAEGVFFVRGERLKPRHLPRQVQVVLQNAGHQLRMPGVREELRASLIGSGLSSHDTTQRVNSALKDFHLEALSGRHPQSLSGGEKQRLAVACATIRHPGVLFLDEPTSGLDADNMRRIAEAVRATAAQGSAVLVITHDLELMAGVCGSKLELHRTEPDSGTGGHTHSPSV